MKIKYLYIVSVVLLLLGCENSDLPVYDDVARIRITGGGNYSFVFEKSDMKEDTVWFSATVMGLPENRDRRFILAEWPENKMDTLITKDVNGKPIDTTIVNTSAVAGKHYVSLDNPWILSKCVIPANQVSCQVPIILLRDSTLTAATYRLRIQVLRSDDFELGVPGNLTIIQTLTDKLSKPSKWNSDTGWSSCLGVYSRVKHRFMIDVTGIEWSDDFLGQATDYGGQVYYRDWLRKELANYNANPENPDRPLRDEYKRLVEFPK